MTLDKSVPPLPPVDLSTQNSGVGPLTNSRTSGVRSAAKQLALSGSPTKLKSTSRFCSMKLTADRISPSFGQAGSLSKRNDLGGK